MATPRGAAAFVPRAALPSRRAQALLLALLALLPYSNAWRAGFVYDDVRSVVEHSAVQTRPDLVSLLRAPYWEAARTARWRPVATLSFALDDALADDSAPWAHAVNVALHIAVTLMGWSLARRLGAGSGVALAASALFAVHPLHSEAVTWVSGRAELLAALGALAALRIALAAGPLAVAGSTLAVFAALGAKESAASVPFALLYLRWGLRRAGPAQPRPAVAHVIGAFVALSVFGALRLHVLGDWGVPVPGTRANPLGGTTLFERLPTVLDVAGRALALLAWPHPLSIDYSDPVLSRVYGASGYAVLGAAASSALLALALWRPTRPWGWGSGLALLSFFPASNLAVVIDTIMAERLLYLPSWGLTVATVAGGAAVVHRRPSLHGPAHALLGVALLVAMGLTFERNRDYRNDLTLAEATLAAQRSSPHMSFNRARELGRRNRHHEALEAARIALAIAPEQGDAVVIEVNALVALGRGDEAREVLRARLARYPAEHTTRARLALLLDEAGDAEASQRLAEQALEVPGLDPLPWLARAAAAAEQRGDLVLAASHWQRLARARADDASIWNRLAAVALRRGDAATALRAFETARAAAPDSAEAHNGAAWALLELGGDAARAARLAARAVALDASGEHLDTLARARAALGDCAGARAAASRAAALLPRDAAIARRAKALRSGCAAPAAASTARARAAAPR